MKRGFTLIELLAVIVVLAIIALIATPIVMRLISGVQEGAAKRSAERYLDAVELTIAKSQANGQTFENGTYVISSNGNLTKDGKEFKVDVKGNIPNVGSVIVIINGQIVSNGTFLKFDKFTVIITENGKMEVTETKDDEYVSTDPNCFVYEPLSDVVIPTGEIITNKDGKIIYGYICEYTDIVIPEGIVEIAESAFSYKHLTSVVLPDSVKIIGERAFEGCDLKTITLGENIESIGEMAFFKDSWELYPGSNMKLATIYNKSGRVFNWGDIINSLRGYEFASGTVYADYCYDDIFGSCVDTKIIVD